MKITVLDLLKSLRDDLGTIIENKHDCNEIMSNLDSEAVAIVVIFDRKQIKIKAQSSVLAKGFDLKVNPREGKYAHKQ